MSNFMGLHTARTRASLFCTALEAGHSKSATSRTPAPVQAHATTSSHSKQMGWSSRCMDHARNPPFGC
eukprot:2639020-Amphidinium_carterae.1